MTHILSKEERTQIVNSRKKNLAMNEYNLDLTIIEENAKVTPDQESLVALNAQISVITNQLAALDAELVEISPLEIKAQKRMELVQARTLEELVALGRARNYQYPVQWAQRIIEQRNAWQNKKRGVIA